MSADIGLASAARVARAALWPGLLSGGSLVIYDGAMPSTPDTGLGAQVALVTFSLPDPAGESASGVFTGADLDPVLVSASGTAAWARAYDSEGAALADFSVGAAAAAILLSNVSLVEGAYLSLSAWAISET